MKTLTLALAAGAAALFATAASAAPLSIGPVASDSHIQNVRMVCDEDGRCWRERGERRVILREFSQLVWLCAARALHRASRL